MSKPLLLKISVANPTSPESDSVYSTIENGLKDAECYRLGRSKVTAAAIEFLVILTSAAAVATIANFLYNVWKDNRDKGELYIAIDPDSNTQIMISGKTIEVEIEDFQRKIDMVQRSDKVIQMDQELLDEIRRKRIWIRTR